MSISEKIMGQTFKWKEFEIIMLVGQVLGYTLIMSPTSCTKIYLCL